MWDADAARVDELALALLPVTVAEIDAALIADIQALLDGDILAAGLQIYAENCVACHGANGEGTMLAPALNTDELCSRLSNDEMATIVTQGVPGTLMAIGMRMILQLSRPICVAWKRQP